MSDDETPDCYEGNIGANIAGGRYPSAAPVRLCCGQRHYGALCPDGKVMCCLCFGRFPVDELSETVDGDKQDVCLECAAAEEAYGLHDKERLHGC